MSENSPLYYNADLTNGTQSPLVAKGTALVPVEISKDGFSPKTSPIKLDSPKSNISPLKKKAKELPKHDTADCLVESKITHFATTPKPHNLTCNTDKPITENDLDDKISPTKQSTISPTKGRSSNQSPLKRSNFF